LCNNVSISAAVVQFVSMLQEAIKKQIWKLRGSNFNFHLVIFSASSRLIFDLTFILRPTMYWALKNKNDIELRLDALLSILIFIYFYFFWSD